MAPDVWGRRVAGGGAAAIVEEAGRHAVRQRRMAMPLRWKTSRLLGSRRANAATNRQSAARISFLRHPGVVGKVEDVLPRGGQVGADGKVLGVLEEALAGGILPQAVGEAGHGVERAPCMAALHMRQRSARDSVGQTSGATQCCLNLGFSERFGNSRRHKGLARRG